MKNNDRHLRGRRLNKAIDSFFPEKSNPLYNKRPAGAVSAETISFFKSKIDRYFSANKNRNDLIDTSSKHLSLFCWQRIADKETETTNHEILL